MKTNSTPDYLMQLVRDLEQCNTNTIRLEAARKLGKIGICNPVVVHALQKGATDIYAEFSRTCKEALDNIYTISKIQRSKSRSRNYHQTHVEITLNDDANLEVSDSQSYCYCNFCYKKIQLSPSITRFTEHLSGHQKFFCPFCLRHKLNHRDSRNTLLLTFRGIIGYYYYAFHQTSKPQMYVSEIMDYVNLHVKAGMQNPLFLYDPETFLWFIDFTRVGKNGRKLPVERVLETIGEILLSFSLYELIKDIKVSKLYLKYEEAIFKFYHQRTRPTGMRVLSPTLKNTGASEFIFEKFSRDVVTGFANYGVTSTEKKRIPIEETRHFLPCILEEAMGKKF